MFVKNHFRTLIEKYQVKTKTHQLNKQIAQIKIGKGNIT